MNHLVQLQMVKLLVPKVPKAKRGRKQKVVCSTLSDPASKVRYRGYDWRLPIAA